MGPLTGPVDSLFCERWIIVTPLHASIQDCSGQRYVASSAKDTTKIRQPPLSARFVVAHIQDQQLDPPAGGVDRDLVVDPAFEQGAGHR